MSDATGLDPIISGISEAEKKEIIVDFVDSGLEIDPDDLMLKVPGLANHFRKIAEAQAQITKSLPLVLDRQLGERLAKYETTLSERIDRYEAMLSQTLEKIAAVKMRSAPTLTRSTFNGFSPMSGLIGAIGTLLVTIPLFWYAIVPMEVARQRGGDWEIVAYLKTAQGAGFRQFYINKCRNKPDCK